jgi:hypothetical protein
VLLLLLARIREGLQHLRVEQLMELVAGETSLHQHLQVLASFGKDILRLMVLMLMLVLVLVLRVLVLVRRRCLLLLVR